MLIVIEGCDASGKATQSKRIAQLFGGEVLAFPRYNTNIGNALQRHLKGYIRVVDIMAHKEHGGDVEECVSHLDALFFQALMTFDRYAIAPRIKEALNQGKVLVLDRYWQSGYCYGEVDGLPGSMLLDVHKCLPEADINIFIDVSVKTAQARRPEARDRIERDKVKMEMVRENYKSLWGSRDKRYWRVINGERSEDEVYADIVDAVLQVSRENYRHVILEGNAVHIKPGLKIVG